MYMREGEPRNPGNQEQGDKQEMPKALFDLGQLAATPASVEVVASAGFHPIQFFARHVSGDWGELPPEDIQTNKDALMYGERIFSAYNLNTGEKIYVITEWDRSVTTLLLPSEY